jgi:hypothetical protein
MRRSSLSSLLFVGASVERKLSGNVAFGKSARVIGSASISSPLTQMWNVTKL